MKLIGVSGRKRGGKDLTGKIIQYLLSMDRGLDDSFDEFTEKISEYTPFTKELISGFKIVKFVDKLKDITCLLIGCTRDQLEDEDFKNKKLGGGWGDELTPRIILQKLGTDLIRNQLHEDAWVNATMSKYTSKSSWVVTDVRFPNEVEAIKSKGG